MTAVELLERQHRDIAGLFERIERGQGDVPELVDELGDALVIHTALEEKYLYPSSSDLRSEEDLRDAIAEHLVIKHAVADLFETNADDTSFHIKLAVLKRAFEKHVKDEEENLFVCVRKTFDEGRLASMG